MNLRQLYYFRTIAELEHYTRAAEKLFISQSNLSHAIRDMESELNVKLFTRKGKNIKLTKYGELFLPYAQRTIETLESGISALQDYINPDSGTVTVAGEPSLAAFLLDLFVKYLSDPKHMVTRFQFMEEGSLSAREQLLGGKADLVLAAEFDDPNIESVCIGQHPLVLLVSPEHRLSGLEQVSLSELDGEDFVAFARGDQLRHQCEELFREFNIHPNIVAETQQDTIIYGLVAANHGVAITPYPLGEIPYQVKAIPISDHMPHRNICLMWHKERYISRAAEYFRSFVIANGMVLDNFRRQKSVFSSGLSQR